MNTKVLTLNDKNSGAINRKWVWWWEGASLGKKQWVQFKVTTGYTNVENIGLKLDYGGR